MQCLQKRESNACSSEEREFKNIIKTRLFQNYSTKWPQIGNRALQYIQYNLPRLCFWQKNASKTRPLPRNKIKKAPRSREKDDRARHSERHEHLCQINLIIRSRQKMMCVIEPFRVSFSSKGLFLSLEKASLVFLINK